MRRESETMDGEDRLGFTCEDCGARVSPAHVRGDPPVCAVCRFIQLEPGGSRTICGACELPPMDRNPLLFRLALVWLAIVPAVFVYALFKSLG